MIDKSKIERIVLEELKEEMFIVDIQVSTSNNISVLIDSDTSVVIDDCVKISRKIEGSLDREAEDFELSVSSAGLGQPLILSRQYKKNIGREVEVVLTDGKKMTGKLISVAEEGFSIEYFVKEKIDGKKKKELKQIIQVIEFDNVKSTKVVVSFK